jgi:hypothetical protein
LANGKAVHQLRILILLSAVLEAIPLFSFLIYLWSLGNNISKHHRRFPLPGQKVIRNSPILEGQAPMTRGRVLKTMAVFLAISGVMVCFFLWWLISILDESVA